MSTIWEHAQDQYVNQISMARNNNDPAVNDNLAEPHDYGAFSKLKVSNLPRYDAKEFYKLSEILCLVIRWIDLVC